MSSLKQSDLLAAAVAALVEAGFVPAGETRSSQVRVSTGRSPVYGGMGGEARTFGGRSRFEKPGTAMRVTVGLRTVCFYEMLDGKAGAMENVPTKDTERVRAIARAGFGCGTEAAPGCEGGAVSVASKLPSP